MKYLQEHMEELKSRVKKVEELEEKIKAVSSKIKLDEILKTVEDAKEIRLHTFVRENILGIFSDDELKDSFSMEDLHELSSLSSEIFNSTRNLVKGTQMNSPERKKEDKLYEVVSAFIDIAYEAITREPNRGGQKLIREIYPR